MRAAQRRRRLVGVDAAFAGVLQCRRCCYLSSNCVPLHKDLDTEQGATLLVNPLAAVGSLDEAKKRGAKGVMQTAAASQAGRMIIRLAQDAGTPLVNIVRLNLIFQNKRVEGFSLLNGFVSEGC